MKKVFKVGCGIFVAFFVVMLVLGGVISAFSNSGEDHTTQLSSPPMVSTPSTDSSSESAGEAATFISVIDGDTIETSVGRVRIIGIDTPERDECGHPEASTAISNLIAKGDPITLTLPVGQNDQDSYGRLLRYVETSAGVDIGLMQLQAGNAVARYDSQDAYPAHPKEAEYHAAQLATSDENRNVVTTACQASAPATPVPLASAPEAVQPAPPASNPPATETPAADAWWRQYSSCSKLKKNTVGHPKGPFSISNPAEAEIYDWFQNHTGHRGDGDGDGLACE